MHRSVDNPGSGINHGFTIVELMVVVVVIAILAAISIVAYTGVQNRAHDSVVQQNLRQIGTALDSRVFMGDRVPHVMYAGDDDDRKLEHNLSQWSDVGISKGSYSTEQSVNLVVCKIHDGSEFSLAAWSRSGNGFAYQNGAVASFGEAPGAGNSDTARICEAMGFIRGGGLPASKQRWGSGWLYENHQWRL